MEATLPLRGVLAMGIVIHHISLRIVDATPDDMNSIGMLIAETFGVEYKDGIIDCSTNEELKNCLKTNK